MELPQSAKYTYALFQIQGWNRVQKYITKQIHYNKYDYILSCLIIHMSRFVEFLKYIHENMYNV
jgi:hypothetical protein